MDNVEIQAIKNRCVQNGKIISALEAVSKEHPEVFMKLLCDTRMLASSIQTNIINRAKGDIARLAEQEQYTETIQAISSLDNLAELKLYVSDFIEVMEMYVPPTEDGEEINEQLANIEPAVVYEGWQNLWDITDGKRLKYTMFKYQVDGVDKENSEVSIKSAKDVTVQALKIAYELNPKSFKELAEDDSKLSSEWPMSAVTKPAYSEGGLKAAHDIGEGLFVETGFSWERRLQYIKTIFELLDIDRKGILVQVRNDQE